MRELELRGPAVGLFPPDVDEAGLPVELGAIDEDPGEAFFDELACRGLGSVAGGPDGPLAGGAVGAQGRLA